MRCRQSSRVHRNGTRAKTKTSVWMELYSAALAGQVLFGRGSLCYVPSSSPFFGRFGLLDRAPFASYERHAQNSLLWVHVGGRGPFEVQRRLPARLHCHGV